jgi:serine/threonine-protein kinase
VLGTNIGNYAVTATIGQGGMGAVYLAEHAMLGRRAAVKVLLPALSTNRDIVARFFNEARALSAIRHPGIVEIFDFGYLPDASAYIVMEYLEGENLGARCRRLHQIDPRRALAIVRQIACALIAAHERGIVHRDLKPDNIFLVADPEVAGGERIKVLDFGVAKLATPGDHARTQTGSVLGTPTYMSPEQCRGAGSVDARSDVYALGCVLFEMLCGRPPFVAEGMGEVIAYHMFFPPPAPRSLEPAIPEPIEQLVLWLLEKEAAARPQSARDVVEAIDRIAASAEAGVQPPAAHQLPTLRAYIGSPPTPPAPLALPSSPLPRLMPPTTPMPTQMRTQMPITTLSGAAGFSGTRMPRIRPPGRRRWVIPIAGPLVAFAVALAIMIARPGHVDRAGEPAAIDGTSAAASSAASGEDGPASARSAAVNASAASSPIRGDGTSGAQAPLRGGTAARVGGGAAADAESPDGVAAGAARAAGKIRLAIDSVPRGATVSLAGKAIGTTPFGESQEPLPGERVYTLDKAGYEPATVTLATDRAGSQRVMLKKKRVARPARGSADSVGDKGVNPFD